MGVRLRIGMPLGFLPESRSVHKRCPCWFKNTVRRRARGGISTGRKVPCYTLLAWHLIAELGVDMTVFADTDHSTAWARLDSVGLGRFPDQARLPACSLLSRQGA
jgi:hypothetical protein